MQIKIGLWVDLYGRVLIIVESLLPTAGLVSAAILVSWIFVAFLKIIITTIKAGGVIKMCCRSVRIGTMLPATALMYG